MSAAATANPVQPVALDDFGIRNRNLPDCLKQSLIKVIKEAQAQEKWIRLQEILEDAEHRFYDMGIQHIYQDRNWCWSQAIPGGTYGTADGGEDSFPDYIGDYNITTAYNLIQQAKISEPDIGIDWQPINPDSSEDRESANAAETIRHQIDIDNDPKGIVQEIVYYLQMGGRAMTDSRTVDEASQFGTNPNGTPRRKTCVKVGGCLEWKVPIFADKLKDFWYAVHYSDPDVRIAKTDYPWIADNIKNGQVCLGENSYERIARLAVVQTSQGRNYNWNIGDAIQHLTTRGDIWLRLSAFESCKNEEYRALNNLPEMNAATGKPKSIRDKWTELCPEGVHAVVIGQNYAECWNESMDDHIRVGHAYIGKGQNRQAIMRPLVLVQDRFNQTVNYIGEDNDFGAPSTYFGGDAEDYAAITKQHARPGSIRYLKNLMPNQKVQDLVYREQKEGIPTQFMEYLEFMQDKLPQFQLQLPPSAWGAISGDTKTAEVYQMSAQQSMGIQGKLRTRVIDMMSGVYYQLAMAVAKDEKYADEITVPVAGQKGRTQTVRKESLVKGNFRCFPDKNSGFPESTAQIRQSATMLAQQLQNTPLAGQFWSSPSNVAEMVRIYGIPNLVVPEAEAWNRQSAEIEILLRGSPVFGDPDLVLMLNGDPTAGSTGAGVQAMVDAIKAKVKAAVSDAQNQLAQQAAITNQTAQTQHAGETLVAHAAGQQETPAPPIMPPPQLDPDQIYQIAISVARSSVPVWDSDYHQFHANKCQDVLNDNEWIAAELIVGRTSPDPNAKGASVPNVAGVLNVVLHRLEHLLKAPTQPAPPSGPLPTVGSPPKQLPQPANV